MRQDDASTICENVQSTSRVDRRKIVSFLDAIERSDLSQRQAAEQFGLPRSTIQYWAQRSGSLDDDQDLVRFFESPSGLTLLERLVVSAHLVFTQQGPAGIRLVGRFFDVAGLGAFVPTSYGSQHRIAAQLEQEIVDFGREERTRLAGRMTPRSISLCVDETFHPETCLVAIEPVSNFLVVEAYAQARDAGTWSEVLSSNLNGIPVDIIQITSDEASGLIALAEDRLDAHHSPDLFHVQHEAGQGIHLPLRSQVKKAEKALENATAETEKLQRQKQEWFAQAHGPGRTPDFDQRIAEAQERERRADEQLEDCVDRQVQAKNILQGIGTDYHPFDLQTGAMIDGRGAQNKLRARFDSLEALAGEAGLGERSKEHLAKARRVLPLLVATIAWVTRTIREWVEDLALSPALERLLLTELIPGLYLQKVAAKAATAEERAALTKSADRLLAKARSPNHALAFLPDGEREIVERVAQQCANLFQRSSSCVEGRNGQLSLRHHNLHRLRPRKLEALTVVHNYLIRRHDGTTAAERFFGHEPRDLVQYLFARVRPIPYPAKRPTPQTQARAA